jgi:hypothetical protein
MTKDEVYEMSPRMLNEMIARFVMRWRRIEYDQLPERHWPWLTDEGHRWEIPNFSQDIKDAWKVHRKLVTSTSPVKAIYLHILADILTYKYASPPSIWTAPLECFDADTICRAALLAVSPELD